MFVTLPGTEGWLRGIASEAVWLMACPHLDARLHFGQRLDLIRASRVGAQRRAS